MCTQNEKKLINEKEKDTIGVKHRQLVNATNQILRSSYHLLLEIDRNKMEKVVFDLDQ